MQKKNKKPEEVSLKPQNKKKIKFLPVLNKKKERKHKLN